MRNAKPPLCCGRPRRSPYCPECGACLETKSLYGLLAYCRGIHARLEKRQQEWQVDRAAGVRRHATNYGAALSKWQAWIQALEAVLFTDAGTNHETPHAPAPPPAEPAEA
jgi:hypothetical protein